MVPDPSPSHDLRDLLARKYQLEVALTALARQYPGTFRVPGVPERPWPTAPPGKVSEWEAHGEHLTRIEARLHELHGTLPPTRPGPLA